MAHKNNITEVSKPNSPKKQLHASPEGLKVDDVVERALLFDMAEHGHANDGVDECDEGQERADVEQRRQGYH